MRCASLHSPDGRVNIPGFYDDVIEVEPWERQELKKLGADEAAYAKFLAATTAIPGPGTAPHRYLQGEQASFASLDEKHTRLQQALIGKLERMRARLDPGQRSVMVAHAHVRGSQILHVHERPLLGTIAVDAQRLAA